MINSNIFKCTRNVIIKETLRYVNERTERGNFIRIVRRDVHFWMDWWVILYRIMNTKELDPWEIELSKQNIKKYKNDKVIIMGDKSKDVSTVISVVVSIGQVNVWQYVVWVLVFRGGKKMENMNERTANNIKYGIIQGRYLEPY